MALFSFKQLTLGGLLILAIGLSLLSIRLMTHPPVTSDGLNNQPDAWMEDVIATMINKNGQPALKIVSPKMVHYAEDDTTNITQPIKRKRRREWRKLNFRNTL
jgi:LPS export ABC transporter protein LptC